jgi:hypothetical protein
MYAKNLSSGESEVANSDFITFYIVNKSLKSGIFVANKPHN